VADEDVPPEDDRLAHELAEELRRLRVEDVLIQTLVTVSSIAYRRLGLIAETEADRDLDQTRLAIETMQALVPVLGAVVPRELVGEFEGQVASLKLAYAKAAQGGSAAGEPGGEA
jgi:hypothetical protein